MKLKKNNFIKGLKPIRVNLQNPWPNKKMSIDEI